MKSVTVLALAALVAGLTGARARAQTATAPVLKAAFLLNLAKFVEWPADVVPAGGPITLCVSGDPAVAEPLADSVKGHTIEDHPLAVRRLAANDGALRGCQLLYMSGLDAPRTAKLIESLAGVAIFTVSDLDRFAQTGGVAQLFVDGDRLRFAINVDAAQRARLRLSSKLLSLARIVRDEHNAALP